MKSRLKALLDVITTIAMIGAAAAVIWTTVGPSAQGPPQGTTVVAGPGPSRPVYQPGEKLGPVPGFHSDRSPKTLILFLRSTCKYCTESMDFYARLVTTPSRPRIVVIGTEPEGTLREYTKTHALAADQILTVPPSAVRFGGTPALALVGSDGTVEKIWRGKLTGEQEHEVISSFGS